MSFHEYIKLREGFRVLTPAALPVLAQINPWPTTSAHRRKLVPKPLNLSGTMPGPAPPTLKPGLVKSFIR